MCLASIYEYPGSEKRTNPDAPLHAHMHAENASLNCFSLPKYASVDPEGRNMEEDEDQRMSVAVQLISEIRAFREMRTESER